MPELKATDYKALDRALWAVFAAERDCEAQEHHSRPEAHTGLAEWYVHVKHDCGYDVVKAYCAKFKETLFLPDTPVICGGCGDDLYARQVVMRATPMR